MGAWSLAAVAGIMLAYIALQTWRPGVVPPAIAFTAAGLVVGTEGLGWIELSPDAGSLRLLAEATLALVLFSDASRIDLRALRDGYALPARLLGIGLPLTIAAGTVAALVVLPQLSPAEALVLAIVLAATDAALGQAVVTDERLPASIRQGLNVESGLNDGLCVPALVIALALANPDAGALSGSAAGRVVAESIGYGVLMGARRRPRRRDRAAPGGRRRWRGAGAVALAADPGDRCARLRARRPARWQRLHRRVRRRHRVRRAWRPARDAAQPLPAQDLGTLLNALTFVAFGAAFMKPLIERATLAGGALRAAQPHRRAHAAGRDRDARHPLEPRHRRLPGLVRAPRPGLDRLRGARRGGERPALEHDRRRDGAHRDRLGGPARH